MQEKGTIFFKINFQNRLFFQRKIWYNTNMKIRELLKNGTIKLTQYKIQEPISKTRILLMYEMGLQNEYLTCYLEEEARREVMESFEKHLEELANGKPLQYITHRQDFYGFTFQVDENVLIPQPDTEILVQEIIYICKYREETPKILDICTGSGAIAVALARSLQVKIVASDISQKALEIASRNAIANHTKIKFVQSDMFEKIDGTFDVIVSNPPYIATQVIQTLSPEVKQEPILALDGGKDGLDFYRILADQARLYLKENGILAVEIGFDQKQKVMDIFEKMGFQEVYSQKDYAGQDRIVVGKWRKICHFHQK